MLQAAAEPMVRARTSLRQELVGLERQVRLLAKDDAVCRLLMTMPGIGAVVALTFRSAVDDPGRFSSSKKVGLWVGLTPSRNQSGERDVIGGITRASDANLRRALCQAATVMIHRGRSTWLRSWAAQVAKRRGAKRAMVALARRIGTILHRMWKDTALNSLQSHCSPSRPEHLHQNHIVDVCLTADLRGPNRDAVPMMPWSGL